MERNITAEERIIVVQYTVVLFHHETNYFIFEQRRRRRQTRRRILRRGMSARIAPAPPPRVARAPLVSSRSRAQRTAVVPASSSSNSSSSETLAERARASIAAVALALTLTLASAPDADAQLSNPNTRLPRNTQAALRRAVPAVNEETKAIQLKLEDAAYLFRIPSRQPWATMAKDIDESRAILLTKRDDIFGPVRENDRASAEAAYGRLDNALERLSRAAATQDFDTFDAQIASSLTALSELQIDQAPGLPFGIPTKYLDLPRLVGRAKVEIDVANADARANFGLINGDVKNQVTLEITVDGYNAPVTAGNFVDNVRRGVYKNAPLRRSETSILGGSSDVDAPSVPLEIKASDAFEPLYRSPLDVQSGEAIPSIPLSINGSVAMARAKDGQSDAQQFFIYLFDKRSAGLGGLSFEEGEFAVFGYVTKGEEFLNAISTDARIVNARVVSGEDKLVNKGVVAEEIATDFPPEAADS
jgi:cyclophilin family peptidyl-prolyl cis-trans isomerase